MGFIDWECAICKVDIKSKMSYKKVENLVCKKCKKVHNSKNQVIDQRIIDSSVKFLKACKKLVKGEQREFLTYVKRSTKV